MALRRQESFPRPGQRWAHFEVTGEVARGNMGVVFRARDLQRGRDVALKVLVVGHDDPDAGERFKREARSLARLSSRHIVSVHSYGVHEGLPFLSMDFVPGTTLQDLLDRGALPFSRAADLLARIAHAMDHAHSRGVLHRDLKPSNVLIGADGEPRITDFGLARLDDASRALTREGDLVGTPVYMAPEQVTGDLRALAASTDVWALGVMLYVALTGALPFRGDTVDEVVARVKNDDPAPPRALRPDAPADLEEVCLAALRKDWRARYQSAGELARDLERYLRGRPVLAGRVTAAVRARRALRAVRLHAGAVAIVVAALVLGLGLGVGRWLDATSRTERGAAELVLRAVQRRAAAQVAVRAADEAWGRADLARAAEQAQHALTEAAWAASYLERAAARAGDRAGRLDEALGAPPRDDEVALGLARDPTLQRLHARGRALAARAAEGAGGPAQWAALEAGYRATGDLADLEALALAAERSGSLAPARRARAALTSHPTDDPDATRLRGRLAALGATAACCAGGGPSTCGACGHACAAAAPCGACGLDAGLAARDDAVGVAAREVLARAALARDDPAAARALLGAGAPPLLRAEVARALGRAAEQGAALAPLLAAGDARAWLERARGLLDDGWPRAGDVAAAALLIEGAAAAATGEAPAPLEALARAAGAPLALRLEAARLLVLAGAPAVPVPPAPDDPTAPVARAAARLRLARAAPIVAAALGRLALRDEGLDDDADLDAGLDVGVDVADLDLDALEADARRLGEADALAAVAVLRRVRDGAPAAESPATPPARRPAAPGEAALAEGRAWLGGLLAARAAARAAALAGGLADADQREAAEALERAVARARAALDLAVHLDPLAAAPLSARAALRLSLAAADGDDVQRALAQRDAAAAMSRDPTDAAARWTLLAALAVVDPGAARDRLARPGPPLPPGQRRVLARADDLRALAGLGWTSPSDPDDQDALRAAALLLRLAGREPPAHPEDVRVADALRRRLQEAPAAGLEADLLQATLVLEDPAEVEAWLLHRRWTASEGELARALDGPRGAAARVALLLQALNRLPPGAAPEALADARARARAHLEAVARAHPGPAVQALRAAIEVWTGAPDLELHDLLAHPWPGALREVLRAAAARQATPGAAGGLWEHAAVRRLLDRTR